MLKSMLNSKFWYSVNMFQMIFTLMIWGGIVVKMAFNHPIGGFTWTMYALAFLYMAILNPVWRVLVTPSFTKKEGKEDA